MNKKDDIFWKSLAKEVDRKKKICPVCLGQGTFRDGGMFSQSYPCDFKDCGVKKQKKTRAKSR